LVRVQNNKNILILQETLLATIGFEGTFLWIIAFYMLVLETRATMAFLQS